MWGRYGWEQSDQLDEAKAAAAAGDEAGAYKLNHSLTAPGFKRFPIV